MFLIIWKDGLHPLTRVLILERIFVDCPYELQTAKFVSYLPMNKVSNVFSEVGCLLCRTTLKSFFVFTSIEIMKGSFRIRRNSLNPML